MKNGLRIRSEDSYKPRRRILHDPVKYPEPFKFNPDRFLGGDDDMSRPMTPNLVNENPWHYIFGFGLRCASQQPTQIV